MLNLDLIPVVINCICRLQNFLVNAEDMANIPIIGSGMGYFGSRTSQTRVLKRLRATHRILVGATLESIIKMN